MNYDFDARSTFTQPLIATVGTLQEIHQFGIVLFNLGTNIKFNATNKGHQTIKGPSLATVSNSGQSINSR